MTDFSALSFEEVIARIEEPMDTLVLFHRNPDADAVGSAFALKEVLRQLGSAALCACADETPARLRFLCEGEQESTRIEALPENFSPARVIAVDTASPAQLGNLWESYEGHIDLMLDHHASGEVYADHYIRPDAAATGEVMFDIVKQLATAGRIEITEGLCVRLYAAISADTGGFRFSNVTPETHMRAAELLASGIDSAEINRLLFDTNTMDQLRARAAGISNLHLFADGAIAVITFPYALKVALGLSDEHLDSLVDIARSLAGVRVAVSIRQPGTEGVFRVSVRSSCEYDVSALCARFGGGGHMRAAGCTLTASDMDEAMNKLVSAIEFKNE